MNISPINRPAADPSAPSVFSLGFDAAGSAPAAGGAAGGELRQRQRPRQRPAALQIDGSLHNANVGSLATGESPSGRYGSFSGSLSGPASFKSAGSFSGSLSPHAKAYFPPTQFGSVGSTIPPPPSAPAHQALAVGTSTSSQRGSALRPPATAVQPGRGSGFGKLAQPQPLVSSSSANAILAPSFSTSTPACCTSSHRSNHSPRRRRPLSPPFLSIQTWRKRCPGCLQLVHTNHRLRLPA